MFEAESYAGHKLCSPGDVVINTMWAWMGGLGVSEMAGIVSPSYGVYRPRSADSFNTTYLDELLRCAPYVTEYTRRSTGIRGSRLRLYADRFLDMPILAPPRAEQDRIGEFIRGRQLAVASFISVKQRQAELYREERRAIVDAALSGDGDGKRRDTGTDWFPTAPDSWDVRRLKYLARHRSESAEPSAYSQVTALENVEPWTGRLIGGAVPVEGPVKPYARGNVLFGRLRPYLAKVVVAPADGACVGEFLVLDPDTSLVVPEYLAMKLRTSPLIARVTRATQGAKMPRVDWGFIGALPIHFPSTVEQSAIVARIADRCAVIDTGLAQIDREVSLAREYLKAVVEDAVTGRVEILWPPGHELRSAVTTASARPPSLEQAEVRRND